MQDAVPRTRIQMQRYHVRHHLEETTENFVIILISAPDVESENTEVSQRFAHSVQAEVIRQLQIRRIYPDGRTVCVEMGKLERIVSLPLAPVVISN